MAYRDIDSILEDNSRAITFIGDPEEMLNMNETPVSGETVVLIPSYGGSLSVKIHHIAEAEGGKYQGAAEHESFEGAADEMIQHLERGDLVEFSHSKISGIHRS